MTVLEADRKHTSLRIPPDRLNQIDQLAHHHNLSRTEYMVRCSLGNPPTADNTDQRLDALEQRMQRLEELAYSQ